MPRSGRPPEIDEVDVVVATLAEEGRCRTFGLMVARLLDDHPRSRSSRSWMRMGSDRTRVPVAWNTAFAMVAETPTAPSSPMPLAPIGRQGATTPSGSLPSRKRIVSAESVMSKASRFTLHYSLCNSIRSYSITRCTSTRRTRSTKLIRIPAPAARLHRSARSPRSAVPMKSRPVAVR